jgi:NADH:ubiquinone oxidoreductase subunit E
MIEVTQEKNLAAIVEAAVDKHGTHADAFIPILLEINHNYGYIPAEAIRLARAKLHQPQEHSLVSEGRLYGLASFYHMLSTEKNGRHVVQFCESAPCHVQGGREAMESAPAGTATQIRPDRSAGPFHAQNRQLPGHLRRGSGDPG